MNEIIIKDKKKIINRKICPFCNDNNTILLWIKKNYEHRICPNCKKTFEKPILQS